jgi:hypothetical protein
MKKENKPLHDTEVLGQTTEAAAVPVGPDELLVFAEELARTEMQLADLAKKAEAVKKDLKSRESAILARRSELAAIVREKKQMRPIDVQLVANFTTGMLTRLRMDTGEKLGERPLTDDERQTRLLPEVLTRNGGNGVQREA